MGGAVGGVVALLLLAVLFLYVRRRRMPPMQMTSEEREKGTQSQLSVYVTVDIESQAHSPTGRVTPHPPVLITLPTTPKSFRSSFVKSSEV